MLSVSVAGLPLEGGEGSRVCCAIITCIACLIFLPLPSQVNDGDCSSRCGQSVPELPDTACFGWDTNHYLCARRVVTGIHSFLALMLQARWDKPQRTSEVFEQ